MRIYFVPRSWQDENIFLYSFSDLKTYHLFYCNALIVGQKYWLLGASFLIPQLSAKINFFILYLRLLGKLCN